MEGLDNLDGPGDRVFIGICSVGLPLGLAEGMDMTSCSNARRAGRQVGENVNAGRCLDAGREERRLVRRWTKAIQAPGPESQGRAKAVLVLHACCASSLVPYPSKHLPYLI